MAATVVDRKGKGRAVDPDYDDLFPNITYKHLLQQNLGVRNPLRVVALCDSDAFYAACEQVRLKLDPSIPLVVQQWDALIAVNYPAREFGISRMDKIKDARKRCPDLVAVHVATYKEGDAEPKYWDNPDTETHKVSLDHYRRESMKIITMFKDGLPTAEVEKASIDEAFIDFTVPVRDILLKRYPYLAEVPPDAALGLDTPLPPPPPIDWTGLGNVIPVQPDVISSDEPAGEPANVASVTPAAAADIDDSNNCTTWHDVALSIAAELMKQVKKDVLEKLGYSTSAGIARNKFLAKLSASYKKKNQLNILRNAAIPNYLRPMAFQKIRFLGGKLGKVIAEEYDVSTVEDLLGVSLEEMQRKFGEGSIWVYEILRGIDRSEVKEKAAVNKSMLASKNLKRPVLKPSEGHHWIRVLAAELALRLNDAREENEGLWPKSLVLHVRQGYDSFKSKQAAFPFSRNVTVDVIAHAGDKLWRELVGTDASYKGNGMKITNVQLSFTGIEIMESGQRGIEGFLGARDGSGEKRKWEESPKKSNASASRAQSVEKRDVVGVESASNDHSFPCPRCKKAIKIPPIASHSSASDAADEEVQHAIGLAKQEHDDWHFAQDLARSPERPPPPKKKAKKKDKDKDKDGIAKFFVKK
ncbi:DNA/RNA polymerase [Rickenella mellea]|uniref:DNA polymerase eta n=1 Tax=Rickenella mellea TaxID=50990 RepID=A0A4Y7QD35_9AGAM|nr:DNA/RNA polymerase [Rickenella mellea]